MLFMFIIIILNVKVRTQLHAMKEQVLEFFPQGFCGVKPSKLTPNTGFLESKSNPKVELPNTNSRTF